MPKVAYGALVVLMLAATAASIANLVLTHQGQTNVMARLEDVEERLSLVERVTKTVGREQRLIQEMGRLHIDLDELRKGATRDDPDSLAGLRKQLDELKKLVEKK
jgi:tetrahydromethanopterin S-methyltransferase subunit G